MRQLGKYTNLEAFAQGGMGIVYRARDPLIGRDVAIKMIHERALDVPEIRERFYREARSAGRLSHENIMVIYDIGEENGDPYIVMELLSGTDLRRLLNADPPPSLEHKLDIALQIARGLHYAHQHNVIHRDIKPENIRILEDGRVKIMDFGIARIDSEARTVTRSSIGTPRYMSPEQIREVRVDHRTDIFSFGVLFYELLTGTNPFSGEHVTTIIYKIIHEQPEPIHLSDSDLSDELQYIVGRCLEKDPARRYQDFGEVIQDLKHLIVRQQQATLTLPGLTGATAAARRPAGRKGFRPQIAIALGALVVLTVAGYFFAQSMGGTAERTETAVLETPQEVEAAEEAQADAPGTTVDSVPPPAPDPGVAPVPPPEAPEDEVQALAADAARARDAMLADKARADAAGAPAHAAAEYEAAARHEQSGRQAFGRDTGEGYRSSHDAFSEARRLYASARNVATLRRQADQARRDVQEARQNVLAQRDDPAVAAAFRQAEALLTEGVTQYDARDYEAGARSFREARQRFAAIQRTLAEQPAAPPSQPDPPADPGREAEAERARTDLRRARETVAPALQQQPTYEQAVALERQGDQAYAEQRFDEAVQYFEQAADLFRETAAMPSPAEEAGQAIRSLVARFEAELEAGDTAGLRALHGFYGSWGEFLQIARDINATVRAGDPVVTGNRATVNLRVQFDYLDNKNRKQSGSFEHVWTVQKTNDAWTIANVDTR